MDAPDRRSGGWSTAPGGPPAPGQPATASGAASPNDAGAGGGSASPGPSQDTSSLPAISLPKGGGAIRGIDEKLTVGQATGTASLTVAIPTTQARQGFGPSLALGYDSGAGNGPFGLGWSLPTASITRKTSTGLPRYEESDVFILSGAEDLVPSQQPPTGGSPRTVGTATYDITAYRPRVEAAFARIERWQDTASGDVHWRSITADNVTSLYGQNSSSRITDPTDPSRIFSWLLDLSYDDRGNAISYVYVAEDGVGAPDLASERNRVTTANRYLKEIRYGNDSPYLPGVKGNTDLPATPADWLFRVVLDYGEHSDQSPQPDPDPGAIWSTREDPFSSYRSGFEIRTYRTCRRILISTNSRSSATARPFSFAAPNSPTTPPVRQRSPSSPSSPHSPRPGMSARRASRCLRFSSATSRSRSIPRSTSLSAISCRTSPGRSDPVVSAGPISMARA